MTDCCTWWLQLAEVRSTMRRSFLLACATYCCLNTRCCARAVHVMRSYTYSAAYRQPVTATTRHPTVFSNWNRHTSPPALRYATLHALHTHYGELTSPDSSSPPMVPCEVSAPSANLDTSPHSSADSPTWLASDAGPLLRATSIDDGAELIDGGIWNISYIEVKLKVLTKIQKKMLQINIIYKCRPVYTAVGSWARFYSSFCPGTAVWALWCRTRSGRIGPRWSLRRGCHSWGGRGLRTVADEGWCTTPRRRACGSAGYCTCVLKESTNILNTLAILRHVKIIVDSGLFFKLNYIKWFVLQ